MNKALFATVLAIAGIAARPAAPSAATVEQSRFASFVAAVFATDFIPSAADPICGIATTIIVQGADVAPHVPPGGPVPDTEGSLLLVVEDMCSNTLLVLVSATLDDVDFVSNANRTSASLSAVATVRDFISNTDITVELDITWTATGGISGTQHEPDHQAFDGLVINGLVNARNYPARAEGSVTIVGDRDFEISSDVAELIRASGGEVIVMHP